MSRTWLTAVLLALMLHLAGALSREARAEDPTDCEPLDAASLEAVIERMSLDAEQAAWLRERLASSQLREPEDLADLPGLSVELRDELEAAWCWAPPVEAEATVAARVKPNASRQEATVRLARGGMEIRAKARRDGDGTSALRGAVRWTRREWTFTAGSVRARQGLGLLVVTAGDEPRGDAPLEPAGGMWRPSLAFDERAAVGMAVVRQGERWSVGGAVLRSRNSTAKDATPRTWSVWRAARRGAAVTWGATFVQAPGGPAGGLDAGGDAARGDWSAEWRRGGSGNAVGVSWGAREGPWRVRASLTHVDAGYAISAIPAYREGEDDDLAGMSAEARWQGGPSRFLRVLVGSGRDPGPYGTPWARESLSQTVEVGERIVPGLRIGFAWRSRSQRSTGGALAESGRERLARGELAWERSGWRLLARTEERSRPDGRGRLVTFRAGCHRAAIDWEARAALARTDGADAPDLWWYRRRAGGLYAWERVPDGSWVGAWARIPKGRWTLEASVDTGAEGWESTLAVCVRPESGGGVDPARRGF